MLTVAVVVGKLDAVHESECRHFIGTEVAKPNAATTCQRIACQLAAALSLRELTLTSASCVVLGQKCAGARIVTQLQQQGDVRVPRK